MKRLSILYAIVLIFPVIAFTSCSGKKTGNDVKQDTIAVRDSIYVNAESKLLMEDLKSNGDYVNSREFPSLIKASVVKEAIDQNQKIHVIDIRKPSEFAQGHIKESVNKRFEDLPAYFETVIKPFEFDKIVLVCTDGQVSSYATSLLRLKGYGNVFAMRWGMSSWDRKSADKGWLSGLSDKFEQRLEKNENPRPPAKAMPELNTGFTDAAAITEARFKKVFEQGTDSVLISADEVFSNPGKYYVINYERKDKYDDAHVPGAVRYKPNATLGFASEMASIPTDKKIVVYCGTGHNSGFATAYLRLLGYDARTLRYGNNGFMHEWMVKDQSNLSWLPFSQADVNDYPVVR
jgi:rhodanese-related sulfurtransferase